MKIKNFTPHALNVVNVEGEVVTMPSEGVVGCKGFSL